MRGGEGAGGPKITHMKKKKHGSRGDGGLGKNSLDGKTVNRFFRRGRNGELKGRRALVGGWEEKKGAGCRADFAGGETVEGGWE